jgi:branched-chain amino acid transport system ATP-binding protein
MRILEVAGIKKSFGGLAAVAGVDFHIDRGEVVGLIGPNGAGKTTLFNLISGAVTPTSGKIKFKGKDITGLKPNKICRQGIARTFQLVKLFGDMTVIENVLLAYRFRAQKSTGNEAFSRCQEMLDIVGLLGLELIPARELTIAKQKQLEIARALATMPEMLLLDEVMAGLNPSEVTKAIEIIKNIQATGITILMVEHVMKAIMEISDRVIVFHNGEKIAEGKPAHVVADETVIQIYLGG